MDKLKKSFSLTLVIWGTTSLSQVSLAQFYVPMQPPVPRHDTMFPRPNGINSTPSSQIESTPSTATESTPSSSSSFNKAACEAAMNRRLQGVDMRGLMSNPEAMLGFGKDLNSLAASTPECR